MKTTQQNSSRPPGSFARTYRSRRILPFAFVLLPCVMFAATNDLSGLLQKGLFEEEANRNLDAAVQAYQSLVTAFDRDRKLAATAVFRLGECYRKLGKTNEAVLQYERIVREFADEATLATLSRQNLAGLRMPATAGGEMPTFADSKAPASVPLPELEKEFALLKAKIEQARKSTNLWIVGRLFDDWMLTGALTALSNTQSELTWNRKRTNSPVDLENTRALEANLKNNQEHVATCAQRLFDYQQARLNVLQSALQQASTSQAVASGGRSEMIPAAASASDEEKEIRRLQAMVKDSPDLLNAPGEGNLTPLCRAANAGWLRAAKFLLDHGASIDRRAGASGWTAMHFAADSGHKAMVELLAERGADVNAPNNNGETALHLAAAKGHLAVAEALIQRKADVNARSKTENEGVTPLQRAAARGYREMVGFLVSKGAKVGAQNASGMTALCYAAMRGHAEVVKALLAAKVDPNEPVSNPPLFCALHQPECLRLLLEAGTKPKVKDRSGQTPLLKTIEEASSRVPFGGSGQEEFECATLLIKYGADVNLTNDSGVTPLQMAVWIESIPMVSLLLSNRADANALDAMGQTALDWALQLERGSWPSRPGDYPGQFATRGIDTAAARKISALLRQHGAQNGPKSRLPGPLPAAGTPASANSLIYVSGEVRSPGALTLQPGEKLTVAKAIVRAGDCTDFANKKKVKVVRAETGDGGKKQEFEVNLTDILQYGKFEQDIELQAGDMVVVPKRIINY